jgi:hypothetical protein
VTDVLGCVDDVLGQFAVKWEARSCLCRIGKGLNGRCVRAVAEVEGPVCHKGLNHTRCWNCADEALQVAGVDVRDQER